MSLRHTSGRGRDAIAPPLSALSSPGRPPRISCGARAVQRARARVVQQIYKVRVSETSAVQAPSCAWRYKRMYGWMEYRASNRRTHDEWTCDKCGRGRTAC